MATDRVPEHAEQFVFEDRQVRFRTAAASFAIEEIGQAIHQRFEKQVAHYGNRIAVRTNGLEWTYEELNSRANRIAHSISAICGTETDPIVLLFGHDAAALPAMIGGLKSGRTYIPISTSNPSMRIRSIMEGARASLIVTHARTIGKTRTLAGGKIRVLNVDEIDRNVSDENPRNPVSPDSFAYILYTSGSSGQPKGVLQTHRNLLHQVYSYANAIGITPSDRLSLLPSFDVGAGHLDLYAALLNGASLSPFNIREEGFQRLTAWLIEERITV